MGPWNAVWSGYVIINICDEIGAAFKYDRMVSKTIIFRCSLLDDLSVYEWRYLSPERFESGAFLTDKVVLRFPNANRYEYHLVS